MAVVLVGVGLGTEGLAAGVGLGSEGLAAGVGLVTGEDLGVALGLAAGVGDTLDAGEGAATGDWTFTLDKPINCHCPLRRANVSRERYCPLISNDLPSVDLTLAFLTA